MSLTGSSVERADPCPNVNVTEKAADKRNHTRDLGGKLQQHGSSS
jgi:hypothetical protein